MNNFKKTEKGFAQLVILGVMALSIVSLSVATKMAQNNQDSRSKAAENTTNIPATGITMDLESPMYLSVGDSLMMKYHLTPTNSTDNVVWSINAGSDIATVDANGLVQAIKQGEVNIIGKTSTNNQFTLQDIVITDKDVGQVDIFYSFRESNDYRVLAPGMDIVGELRLNTFGKALSSAEITYYHTDALDPYLNGITGNELIKVVSHKKYGAWNTLKVEFDKSKKPADSVYVLKIKTKVLRNINNGRLGVFKGLVLYHSDSAEETGTGIFNADNKRMNITHVDGTNFDIGNATNLSPIPTVTSPKLSPIPTIKPTTSKPRLYFETTKSTYLVDENVEITVGVDSALNKIAGIDVLGNYDVSKFDLISMKKSEPFVFGDTGDCAVKIDDLGKFSASCWFKSYIDDKPVFGKSLTMVFKAKAVGKGEFSFDCINGSTYDSNIIGDDVPVDIISCEQNTKAYVTVISKDSSVWPTLIPTKGSKMDGKCGSSKNICSVGKLIDIADTNLDYMWKCNGINDGINKICSLRKTISKKIDGRCGSAINTCISGRVNSLGSTLNLNRWNCIGINGGKTVSCLVWK